MARCATCAVISANCRMLILGMIIFALGVIAGLRMGAHVDVIFQIESQGDGTIEDYEQPYSRFVEASRTREDQL